MCYDKVKLKILAVQKEAIGSVSTWENTAGWEYSINVLVDVSANTISSDVFNEADT